MRTTIVLTSVLALMTSSASAQFDGVGAYLFAEYGWARDGNKGDQLGLFLDSYNSVNKDNLATPFNTKLGRASGTYFLFGATVGGPVQLSYSYALYKTETDRLSARFNDGSGRDIWLRHHTHNNTVGVRVGGTKEIPFWLQADIDIIIRYSTIYSLYIYPDGTPSIGPEYLLNGAYRDWIFTSGTGLTLGAKLFGVGFSASANYVFNGPGRKRPLEHDFTDDYRMQQNDNILAPNYLPKDMAVFVNDPTAPSNGNAITNDIRGWRFSIGLQINIGRITED